MEAHPSAPPHGTSLVPALCTLDNDVLCKDQWKSRVLVANYYELAGEHIGLLGGLLGGWSLPDGHRQTMMFNSDMSTPLD